MASSQEYLDFILIFQDVIAFLTRFDFCTGAKRYKFLHRQSKFALLKCPQ